MAAPPNMACGSHFEQFQQFYGMFSLFEKVIISSNLSNVLQKHAVIGYHWVLSRYTIHYDTYFERQLAFYGSFFHKKLGCRSKEVLLYVQDVLFCSVRPRLITSQF